ncbi:hypothetical protein VTJ83DRAFT_2686 [Remersonia thermophila]|uniref:Acyltransferase 3 domain-containing protein n=1 Tax=Remersonia thermophila TaxID=72144 RepID=A0ABR4DJM9_9PEZI
MQNGFETASFEPKRDEDDGPFLDAGPISLIKAGASALMDRVRNASIGSLLWPWASAPARPERLRPTAYLDGLRGFAAFLVYWHHHELWAHPPPLTQVFETSFGYENHHYFAALPFVRIFFHGGHFAVAVFFVISGYVLSAKSLSLIHAGEQAKLADNLASALFRRWLRLFIPVIITTFVYMTVVHSFGMYIELLETKPHYLRAVWDWFCELKNFSFIFHNDKKGYFIYNFHLWSIPVEFKGSIVVYTSLLALSRAPRNARLWCEAFLVFYFLYIVDGWYCALFVSGMLLNDLDQLAAKNQLPAWFDRFRPYQQTLFYTMLVIALWLGGCPANGHDSKDLRKNPGWWLLSYLKPQAVWDVKWFFLYIAAVLFVSATPRVAWLKRFFETRFCQYLGRISFSLYLVHGPVLWTLGDRVYAAVGWPKETRLVQLGHWWNRFPLPKTGPMGLEVAFVLPHIVLLPVTLYLAELVTHLVDEPSLRFPQWLYKAVTTPRPGRLPA